MGGVICGVGAGGAYLVYFQLKYACNIRQPLPQQSIQKAAMVKAVNTEKHTSEGQLKNENEYQETTQSHLLVSCEMKVQKLKAV